MYFNSCHTAEELKKEYFKLALQHHPDRGGDVRVMQAVNVEYETAWARLKDTHQNAAGKQYTNTGDKATAEMPEEYQRIIDALIRLRGIRIEICGSWIWVSGDTRPHKDQFKALGMYWAPKKEMWYWRPPEKATIRHKPRSMDYIRQTYGSQVIDTEPAAMIQ